MFAEAFEEILRDHCTPATVRRIESGGAHQVLWDAIADAGFLELMAPEDADGAGLDLESVLPVLLALGAYSVPLPVGQTIAARTLMAPGQGAPKGLISLAPALARQGDGSLIARRVPFGSLAEWVIGSIGDAVYLLDARQAARMPLGLRHDPTCDLSWTAAAQGGEALQRMPQATPGALDAWGAALHAALIAGALDHVLELSLRYCNDRVQFGRPIGKFQAIQHELAIMAEEVAAARMAAMNAFPAGKRLPDLLLSAIAKGRASEAASSVAAIAHAVHGAIGITEEYDLQLLTRRLHAWRMAHGSESHWYPVVGRALLQTRQSAGDFVRAL